MTKQIKLIGDRIILRDYVEADRDFYHSWISDPTIMKYVDWGTTSRSESDKNFDYAVSQQHSERRKDFYLVLQLRNNEQPIGNAGISVVESEPSTAEIGWILKPEYRGYGYATEAGKLLIEFGFMTLQVKNIFATCDQQNQKSEAIMLRLGMVKANKTPANLGPTTKIRYHMSV